MIYLKKVNRHNFEQVINLKVAEDQQTFVASNLFSLAQAKVHPECECLAIYNSNEVVGFAMYCLDQDEGEYWVYRLMVDEKHQSKGYGKKAMQQLIEQIKQDLQHHMIYLSFEPENTGAQKLYGQLGFQPDGRVNDGEVVYRLAY